MHCIGFFYDLLWLHLSIFFPPLQFPQAFRKLYSCIKSSDKKQHNLGKSPYDKYIHIANDYLLLIMNMNEKRMCDWMQSLRWIFSLSHWNDIFEHKKTYFYIFESKYVFIGMKYAYIAYIQQWWFSLHMTFT